MNPRASVVNYMELKGNQLGGVIQIGDSVAIQPRTKVIAVQRQIPIFIEDEGSFEKYPLFSRPIPKPGIDPDVRMEVRNESPYIKVNTVKILAIAVSGVLQVGSNLFIESEARVKHFRQILRVIQDEENESPPQRV